MGDFEVHFGENTFQFFCTRGDPIVLCPDKKPDMVFPSLDDVTRRLLKVDIFTVR